MASETAAAPIEAALRGVPFFREVPDAELGEIARAGRSEPVAAGAAVFREGDVSDRLCILLSGAVRIARRGHHQSEVTLSELAAGDVFGELALLDGSPRSASATATADSTLFTLERGRFLELLGRHPPILVRLFGEVSRRFRETNDRFLREVLLRMETEVARHRSIAEMVAGVAHEINTPIGIVNSAASLIVERLGADAVARMGKDEDDRLALADVVEAADLIQGNIARASRLIQSFKSLSVGQVSEVRAEADLPDLVGEVVELYRIEARKARIAVELRIDVAPGLRSWNGYPGYLSQVLLNLLQNVERHAYPDGGGGKVRVGLASEGGEEGRFRLTVRDDGLGIAPGDLPRVFDAFFTTARARGGSGLGMAIVKGLVTGPLHGTIDLESEPGRGTEVTVVFPRTVPGEASAGGGANP